MGDERCRVMWWWHINWCGRVISKLGLFTWWPGARQFGLEESQLF